MNARVWQNLCGAFPLLMVGAALGIFMPNEFFAKLIANVSTILIVSLGLLGGFFGLMLVLGRLYMGCPLCNKRSKVWGGTGKELYLECPSCSHVCTTMRFLRPSVAEQLIEVEDPE